MKIKKIFITRFLTAAVLVASIFAQLSPASNVYAAQIVDRSLTLQDGASDGGSTPAGTVDHLFDFTLPGSNTVGSVLFEYCTLAAGTCTTPTGLDTTGASLGVETGVTGFSEVVTANGTPHLTRSAAAIGSNVTVQYRLDDVVNPSSANETFFVRISTYSSTDATGSPLDSGTVAASTAEPIDLDGTMPESLVFCTGATVTTTLGVPDCSTATAGDVSFDQLFSPTDTAIASSQMAASTNAGSGYAIGVTGSTLTSGGNTVTAMGATDTSVVGTSQFGLNLVVNATPAVGTAVAPAANGSNYRGQAVTNYNTADQFIFNDGDTVADSSNGGAGGTDAQIFTVSYMVNVPGSQPAGTYTTTLTYICTPTF